MAGPSKFEIYQFALRHLGDARLALITDDVEARYALDDAWPRATSFVLRQAAWRYALKTAALVVGGTLVPGYAISYSRPLDWLRTQAIFVAGPDGSEDPFDLREQGATVAVNITAVPWMRYVSSAYLDPAFADWPEQVAQVVAAYLAFLAAERITGERAASGRMSQLFSSLLPEAIALEAMPEDEWLPHQRSGAFWHAAREVISRGFWRWGLKATQYDTSMQQATPVADPGFPYSFALPADWLRTHALYVATDGRECPINIRETAAGWSTDAEVFVARYLSTDTLDATTWPLPVSRAVLAYLRWQEEPQARGDKEGAAGEQVGAAVFEKLLGDALKMHSEPEDQWLRYQLDGTFIQGVHRTLEGGRWRFAVRTVLLEDSTDPTAVSDGTVSPGYTMRLLKPNDWLRTLRLYKSYSDGLSAQWLDIDYRDELDALHANYSPAILRYVSRLGLDASLWTANFRDAVLAWLQYAEIRNDPRSAAVAKAKLELWRLACREAETLDDERDVPKVTRGGRFVRSRWSRGSRDNQGGFVGAGQFILDDSDLGGPDVLV